MTAACQVNRHQKMNTKTETHQRASRIPFKIQVLKNGWCLVISTFLLFRDRRGLISKWEILNLQNNSQDLQYNIVCNGFPAATA